MENGEQARLFLETRNGEQFANLSVKMPVVKPGTFQTNMSRSRNRKSPSSIRRDQNRLKTYLQRKTFQETWSPGKTSTPAKEASQPDLACSSQSVETPTLNEPVQDVSVEGKDLKKDENCCEEEEENTDDGNKIIDTKDDDKKIEKLPVLSIIDKEFIESCKEICAKAIKQTFEEINKAPSLQSLEKEVDNVDSIEEAKLWAVRQKQSLTKN